MTWMGYDEWHAPDGYIDVPEIWPAWEQEGSLVVFWCGRLIASRTQHVFSQRVAVSDTGVLTPDEVNLLADLDERNNWHVANVQLLSNGQYAVAVERREVSSS
jgi:hypothetical protein